MVSPVYDHQEELGVGDNSPEKITRTTSISTISDGVFVSKSLWSTTAAKFFGFDFTGIWGKASSNDETASTQVPQPEAKLPHNGRVNEVFNVMRIVLLILGRFPFLPSTSFTDEFGRNSWSDFEKKEKYKGKNYSSSIKSWSWLYFILTSTFLLFYLILSCGSFMGVFLRWSFLPKWTEKQIILFESNLIPFVLVWSCLLSSTVGNVSFLLNRKNVAKFLNYWNVAMEKMDVDIPCSLRMFLIGSNLWFLGFSILAILSTKVFNISIASEGSTLMGIIILRLVDEDVGQDSWICRSIGMMTILYAMYASRALLFFFVFKCKLLRYCVKVWNARLKAELNEDSKRSAGVGPEALQKEEVNCKKLFQDHVILLKLVRLTDKVFSAILLSYFGSQILNCCFELFYVAVSNSDTMFTRYKGENGFEDTFVAILLLIQNVYVFLSVSLHAAYVAEESNKGFEIIKTKGLSPTDSVFRRHLLLSLQISYQQKLCITGGHFFVVDKPFIITVLGAVFTYFIIILQYGFQNSGIK